MVKETESIQSIYIISKLLRDYSNILFESIPLLCRTFCWNDRNRHQPLRVFVSTILSQLSLTLVIHSLKPKNWLARKYMKHEESTPCKTHCWTQVRFERSGNERCRDGERRWWRRRREGGEEGGNEIALIVWNLILIPDVIWADAAVLKRRGNKRRFRKAPKGSTRATSTWHARVPATLALCQSVKRLSRHFISRLPSPQFVHPLHHPLITSRDNLQ